jgi:hypothetical protein
VDILCKETADCSSQNLLSSAVDPKNLKKIEQEKQLKKRRRRQSKRKKRREQNTGSPLLLS